MKAVIIGTGGIGARHGENLRSLHPGIDLIGIRKEPSETTTRLDMKLFPNLDSALTEIPDMAVIALPPALHAEAARTVLAAGVALYLEKPLALRPADLADAAAQADARGTVTMAGCTLRRLAGVRRIKALLETGAIGAVHHARLSVGQWLPDWRPGRDYRETYSASRALGGGVLLDLIHEIDLARHMFGEFDSVEATAAASGELELDVEDSAEVTLHRGRVTVEVHLNYLDRPGHRNGRIFGERGEIIYNMLENRLEILDTSSGVRRDEAIANGFSVPAALIDAMDHFVGCAEAGMPSDQPISDGLKTLALVEHAKYSAGLLP